MSEKQYRYTGTAMHLDRHGVVICMSHKVCCCVQIASKMTMMCFHLQSTPSSCPEQVGIQPGKVLTYRGSWLLPVQCKTRRAAWQAIVSMHLEIKFCKPEWSSPSGAPRRPQQPETALGSSSGPVAKPQFLTTFCLPAVTVGLWWRDYGAGLQ